jgi:hypothetical protein
MDTHNQARDAQQTKHQTAALTLDVSDGVAMALSVLVLVVVAHHGT